MSDRKLDIISGIDGEIIERNTQKRYILSARIGKKKHFNTRLFTIIAAAALSLALMIGALILLIPDKKQVPVYTGMTVSGERGGSESADAWDIFGVRPISFVELIKDDNGNHFGNENKPVKDAVDDKLSEGKDDGSGEALTPPEKFELYYARSDEDIYITIHFDNPNEFEILSFTFNGQKYTSYMFEEGSDMENIIIKQHIGEVAGLLQYTIDAIKYVDGTAIKDVKMEAENTVNVGVYGDDLQPVPQVTEEKVEYGYVSFSVKVMDSFAMVGGSNGKLYAMLYDGEKIVESRDLPLGEDVLVEFSGLTASTAYQYVIVGEYDAYDQQGKVPHILYIKDITTKTILEFKDVVSTYDSISFGVEWSENFASKSFVSLALYKGEEKICDIDPESMSAHGLLSNTEYTIIAEADNSGSIEKTKYTVRTVAKKVPTLSVEGTPGLTSVDFKVNVTDEDGAGAIGKIELIRDDGSVTVADSTDVRSFADLEKLRNYTVKVTYTYDLNDGDGEQSTSATFEFTTQSVGLKISNGKIWGVGSCTDSEIYLNMPITRQSFKDNANIKTVHIGPGVQNVAESAFMGSALEKVVIYGGVTMIEPSAFSGCEALDDVSIPSTVATIGKQAFADCIALTEITIPEGVTNISCAFAGCVNLTDITIPESVTNISGAFAGCVDLTDITIPESVTDINGAFAGCVDLTDITIPESVTNISDAFKGCVALVNVNIPNGVVDTGTYTFSGCTNLKKIILPDGLEKINGFAFDQSGLEEIEIPNSVTSIEVNAFSHCPNLTKVILSENLSHLGHGVFLQCSALEEIVIPSKVNKILSYTFYGCKSLKKLTISGRGVEIGEYAFENCSSLEVIDILGSVSSIAEKEFSGCSSLTEVRGTLNLAEIPDEAFARCAKLHSITLPNTLKRIGKDAFSGCNALTHISIPSGVTYIGNGAFYGTSIEEITIPAGVTRINDSVFGRTKIKEFVVPNHITYIGSSAFSSSALEKITIPSSVTYIGASAFSNTLIKEIVIPNSVLEMETDFLFASCANLESVTLPSSVTAIGEFMFVECKNLKSIVIPSGVRSIGQFAFGGKCNVNEIYFEGTTAEWQSITFADNWKNSNLSIKVICADGEINC